MIGSVHPVREAIMKCQNCGITTYTTINNCCRACHSSETAQTTRFEKAQTSCKHIFDPLEGNCFFCGYFPEELEGNFFQIPN
jgi:hypothetical protein